jgi:environmental stress-induced protein Ves
MERSVVTMGEPGYAVELVRRSEQHTSAWSGGTTTEIAIFPRNSVYGRRDFLWRISSARVDGEKSTFTHLPGIWRLIMILEGDMTLEHELHHSIRLTPFQQDAFSGAWTTTSRGRARDFNVMLTQGCTGTLQADELQPGSDWTVPPVSSDPCDGARRTVCVVYAVDGGVTACIEGEASYSLTAGDALLITVDRGSVLLPVAVQNNGDHRVHIVTATIQCEETAE